MTSDYKEPINLTHNQKEEILKKVEENEEAMRSLMDL